MSGFAGRRAPNVSEYVANLNMTPSAQDLASPDNLNFEEELAMFTNTQFFDFDLGQNTDLHPSLDMPQNEASGGNTSTEDFKPLDFGLQGQPRVSPISIIQAKLRRSHLISQLLSQLSRLLFPHVLSSCYHCPFYDMYLFPILPREPHVVITLRLVPVNHAETTRAYGNGPIFSPVRADNAIVYYLLACASVADLAGECMTLREARNISHDLISRDDISLFIPQIITSPVLIVFFSDLFIKKNMLTM